MPVIRGSAITGDSGFVPDYIFIHLWIVPKGITKTQNYSGNYF